MQFEENAEVYSADGKKIGHLERVVVDPKTREVSHIVTQKGHVFTREKVIPLDKVEEAVQDRVLLKKGAEEPDQWPDFEKKSHVPADKIESIGTNQANFAKPVMWYHPWVGLPWWGTDLYPAPRPPVYVAIQKNIPEGAVAIEEGAPVISREDQKLGEVEKIYTETQSNRITHVMLSKGVVSKKHKLIPTYWVDRVEEDEVHLSIDSDVVESLPDESLI